MIEKVTYFFVAYDWFSTMLAWVLFSSLSLGGIISIRLWATNARWYSLVPAKAPPSCLQTIMTMKPTRGTEEWRSDQHLRWSDRRKVAYLVMSKTSPTSCSGSGRPTQACGWLLLKLGSNQTHVSTWWELISSSTVTLQGTPTHGPFSSMAIKPMWI
jgi:hypothetical protein